MGGGREGGKDIGCGVEGEGGGYIHVYIGREDREGGREGGGGQ